LRFRGDVTADEADDLLAVVAMREH